MTRIDQVDQALLLLREQLQRMGKSSGRRPDRARTSDRPTLSPMARLGVLAALDDLPKDQFRRTLVRALLTEELGESLANEPAFQAVIEDVIRIVGESEDGQALMAEAARQVCGSDPS